LATSFLALYRGESVNAAKLLAVTADPDIVHDFVARLLAHPGPKQEPDRVLGELERGRRRALQLVKDGAE
jgi:hypothetical protein